MKLTWFPLVLGIVALPWFNPVFSWLQPKFTRFLTLTILPHFFFGCDSYLISNTQFPQDECFNSKPISTQMAAILNFWLVDLILEYKGGSFNVFFSLACLCIEWNNHWKNILFIMWTKNKIRSEIPEAKSEKIKKSASAFSIIFYYFYWFSKMNLVILVRISSKNYQKG